MEFAMSKENIQPLRGGRNAAQLEVGLQAQHNPQHQEELMLQRQQFENAIRTYTGDDPLENYYQYIYWVEQSYPKHGLEGNFVNLLEDCLGRFENHPNYSNDFRFCKLWIKYIDLQCNHTELYQLLYAKRICIGCADMYKAWAYYYEAAGDYKRAEQVFQLGMQELAQPLQDLMTAYKSFLFNAAADHRRLAKQRQALTKLHTFKSGQVGSMRVPAGGGGGAGVLSMGQAAEFNGEHRSRADALSVHEDYRDILFGGGAPPPSVLGVVKRDAPKENVMKAGVWTGGVRKSHVAHKASCIPVHVDAPIPPHELGIQLSASHVTETLEDFTAWKIALCVPDPPNPQQIPMYCKAECYAEKEANREYSIEEVRARRYLRRARPPLRSDASNMETDAAMASNNAHGFQHQLQHSAPPQIRVVPYVSAPQQQQHHPHQQMHHHLQQQPQPPMQMHPYATPHVHSPMQAHCQPPAYQAGFQQQQQQQPMLMHHSMGQAPAPQSRPHYAVASSSALHHADAPYHSSPMHPRHQSPYRHVAPYAQHAVHQPTPPPVGLHQSMSHAEHYAPHAHPPQVSPSLATHSLLENSQYAEAKTYTNLTLQSPQAHASYHHAASGAMRALAEQPHRDDSLAQLSATASPSLNMEAIWNSSESPRPPARPQPLAHFSAYADSPASSGWFQPHLEPKGNAMTTPFKVLSDDELAETGSRGGLDVAAAAQPTDCAKRQFLDDELGNTEMFNLNLMHVSTPESKPSSESSPLVKVASTKKRLFCRLADITEEESHLLSSGSTASSGSAPCGYSVFRASAMEPIKEQSSYDFNLSQNMKANAALRLKLGMDCEAGSESPGGHSPPPPPHGAYETCRQEREQEQPPALAPAPFVPYEDDPEPQQQHVPYPVLNIQPTDPFTNKVLETLLAHVGFPGRHRRNYLRISGVPKLALKKDPCHVGNDRFVVDRVLGKGSYGNVYRATRCGSGEVVALKLQKPANKWEFYICREIQARLAGHPLRDCFMDIRTAYFSDQASVLVSDVHSGSLLDLINAIKVSLTNGPKHQLSIHLTSEMMKIVQALHQVRVIHADIKPDNFLVLAAHDAVRLQLIDFGCSIDMSLMPAGTAFTRKVKTVSFQCCEMKDDRPWSYHTDLFCIAATAHVLLFESYIDVKKADGRWCITKKIPRYYRDELWTLFFSSMLNMQEGLADLDYLISIFSDALDPKELRTATTFINNSFKNR